MTDKNSIKSLTAEISELKQEIASLKEAIASLADAMRSRNACAEIQHVSARTPAEIRSAQNRRAYEKRLLANKNSAVSAGNSAGDILNSADSAPFSAHSPAENVLNTKRTAESAEKTLNSAGYISEQQKEKTPHTPHKEKYNIYISNTENIPPLLSPPTDEERLNSACGENNGKNEAHILPLELGSEEGGKGICQDCRKNSQGDENEWHEFGKTEIFKIEHGDESTPVQDCGTSASTISGKETQNWRPDEGSGATVAKSTTVQKTAESVAISYPALVANYAKNEQKQQFAEFWKLYPKKVGERKAFAEWIRATVDTPPEAILGGLQKFLRAWGSAPAAMCKSPENWLSGGHWNDDENSIWTPMKDKNHERREYDRKIIKQHADSVAKGEWDDCDFGF